MWVWNVYPSCGVSCKCRIFALDIESGMIAATAKKTAEAGLSDVVPERRDFLATGCGRPEAIVG
jgi:hypothetical protein